MKNILLLGRPRSGKSTLVEKVFYSCNDKYGFITKEILEDGERIGFEMITHEGKTYPLSGIYEKSKFYIPTSNTKSDKYYVYPKNIDRMLDELGEPKGLIFIDEIGTMQLFSKKFKKFVQKSFKNKNTVLATARQDQEYLQNIDLKNLYVINIYPSIRDEVYLQTRITLNQEGFSIEL